MSNSGRNLQSLNFEVAQNIEMTDNIDITTRYSTIGNLDGVEIREELQRSYNLEDRLITFASDIIDLTETLPSSKAGSHIAGQLLRSGTSPAPNYGEALGCESRKDFVHKLGVCLKELRESSVWLRIIEKKQMTSPDKLKTNIDECDQLIRILKTSIKTARQNN